MKRNQFAELNRNQPNVGSSSVVAGNKPAAAPGAGAGNNAVAANGKKKKSRGSGLSCCRKKKQPGKWTWFHRLESISPIFSSPKSCTTSKEGIQTKLQYIISSKQKGSRKHFQKSQSHRCQTWGCTPDRSTIPTNRETFHLHHHQSTSRNLWGTSSCTSPAQNTQR